MVEELPRSREPHEVDYGELPELTRALRALGSGRGSGGATQAKFFAPLLDARRKAAVARSADAKLRAFDARELRAGLERCIDAIVTGWDDTREAARRAVRAQLMERVTDYDRELDRLREDAEVVKRAEAEGKLAAWRAWTRQLRAVFQCADRTWVGIEAVVGALPRKPRR